MKLTNVPYVQNSSVINRTILYTSKGDIPACRDGLKVTFITNVDEFYLKDCLEDVINSNLDVIFDTIVYSSSEKTVYFYTDKEISTQYWEQQRTIISDEIKILDEIRSLLNSEKNKDNDCISVYDVTMLMVDKKNEYNAKYEKLKKLYIGKFNAILRQKYKKSLKVYNISFDKVYDASFNYKKELVLFIEGNGRFDKIVYTKKDEVSDISGYRHEEMQYVIGDSLSKCYKDFTEYSKLADRFNAVIREINSKYHFYVDSTFASLTYCHFQPFYREFSVSVDLYSGKYSSESNSNKIKKILEGKEEDILKRIFVKIQDCPEWTQEALCEIRNQQLSEKQKTKMKYNIQQRLDK